MRNGIIDWHDLHSIRTLSEAEQAIKDWAEDLQTFEEISTILSPDVVNELLPEGAKWEDDLPPYSYGKTIRQHAYRIARERWMMWERKRIMRDVYEKVTDMIMHNPAGIAFDRDQARAAWWALIDREAGRR